MLCPLLLSFFVAKTIILLIVVFNLWFGLTPDFNSYDGPCPCVSYGPPHLVYSFPLRTSR